MRALFKAALFDREAVITENAVPVARVESIMEPTAGLMPPAVPVMDERFLGISKLPVHKERQIGSAKGLVIFMADDFNDPSG